MKSSIRATAILAGLALTSLGLVACASGDATPSSSNADNGECLNPLAATLPADPDGAIASLPTGVQGNYSNYPSIVSASPYADFVSPKTDGFVIGYSNSFSGNAWRAAALQTLEENVAAYKELGIVSDLIVTDSNGDNTVQIQQMRSLIQQGVDLILAIPGSPDALNGAIDEAYAAGIPVITVASPVTTDKAINVDVNGYLVGAIQAFGLVNLLEGSGNIMTVQGIPGTSGSAQIEAGGNAIFERCPNIDIVADFAGEWSESVAKTGMLQALSTNPQQLDGVWQQGSMFMGIIQALEQQGRPQIPVTDGNPNQNALAYWRDNLANGFDSAGTANSPNGDMDVAFRVGIRTLLGQGAKIASIVINPPTITSENLSEWLEPSYTIESTGIGVPPAGTWMPDATLDGFFNDPAELPATPWQ